MGRDDAPSFDKSNPALALPPTDGTAVDLASELQDDAAEVPPKCNYVESVYGAGEIYGWASFAKGRDFLMAVQIFRSSEAHCVLGIPEHCGQRLCVVAYQGSFVLDRKSVV